MTSPGTKPPALRIASLSFEYPQAEGEPPFRLELPSLEVRAGEHVLLTAPSGSGKSTLLSLIAGLMEPASGTVEIAGQNVQALRGAKRDQFRGKHLGMIFQTFHLLIGFSAMENVLAALMFSDIPRAQHVERARGLLAGLGLTRLDQHVEKLSVGQQQRVAVARAVACRPALVLADEPTASLDPLNAEGAVWMIREACTAAGAGLLLVSHDPAMVPMFERRELLPHAPVRATEGAR